MTHHRSINYKNSLPKHFKATTAAFNQIHHEKEKNMVSSLVTQKKQRLVMMSFNPNFFIGI